MLNYLLLALIAFGRVAISTNTELGQCHCKCHESEKPRAKYVYPEAFLFNDIGEITYLTFASLGKNGRGPAYFAQYNYFYDENELSGAYGRYISYYFPHWLRRSSLGQFQLVPTKNNIYRIKSNREQPSFLAVQVNKKNKWQWAYFASEEYLKKNPTYISEFEVTFVENEEMFHIRIPQMDYWLSVGVEHNVPAFGPVSYAFFANSQYLEEKIPTILILLFGSMAINSDLDKIFMIY